MTTREEFEAAAGKLQGFKRRPSDAELLELYGLYKQAREGDLEGKRPGLLDTKGRAKHDAWAARRGLDAEEARRLYVEKVEEILERDA